MKQEEKYKYVKKGKNHSMNVNMLKKRKLRICLILCFISFLMLFIAFDKVEASYKLEGIENFPDSYKPYLQEIQKKYPNWKFTALYTELDWEYVIDNENIFGKNLVPKSYQDRWKNTKEGEYNVEVDAGWVDCSRQAIEYTMDPRNFLNEVRLFQFEGLSYDEKTNNLEGIEKILYGTEFYNRIVEYKDSSLNTITTDKKYSELILSAGVTSSVSPYHLASRIKQEVGPFLSHSSISGIVSGFEGLYNFYNIGATSSSEPMGAIKNGLRYAKDGNGASQEARDKYLIPWNTKERAITGGGIFIGSSYINVGQNTIYLQKFDVNDEKKGELFWHQYMTNVLAPYSESKSIYNGYSNSGLLSSSMNFIIPVYNNMPEIPVESPSIAKEDYTEDNTKVYADVTGTLNIRTGPSTSYEVLTQVNRSEIMTRIAKGQQAGELWDRVILSNGMIGYAFQGYLKEVPEVSISEIHLSVEKNMINKNESIPIEVTIYPEEAKNQTIKFSSSDDTIAIVDGLGNVTGIRSGKVTITAKAQNGSAEKSIEIEVYSKVTEIQLDVEGLTLQEGQTFQLNPIIYPEDANNKKVNYESSNKTIASIDENGVITAMKEGECIIKAVTEEENLEKSVELKVIKKIENLEIVFDESLKIQGNEISGLDFKDTTVKNMKDKITTNYSIEVYNNKGELLTDEQLIGTNSKIKIIDDNQKLVMEYIVILYGDVNGDGKINSIDLLVLQRHILEIEKLNGVFLKAGNINKNGKNPSSLDSLLIQRHILGLSFIEQ